ncbi:hypothetical protein EVAR_93372_1 [Eumeta japonica]|uniref:Uncharacterized protein n=1 Tax=Eumeta variegata TaxID=151549 RepID=A0A4C2AC30_EUMVA|nr:hypothetical protein EVAR_93372_1 [Eumeta japonica]
MTNARLSRKLNASVFMADVRGVTPPRFDRCAGARRKGSNPDKMRVELVRHGVVNPARRPDATDEIPHSQNTVINSPAAFRLVNESPVAHSSYHQ